MHKEGGHGKADDKPFLHKFQGVYYLSWGCFYALGASPYGPFNYSGSIIDPARLHGWRTGAVIHELDLELQTMTARSFQKLVPA